MTDYDIKSIRLRTGMTQTEFSKWLHIPKRTLEKWEQKISLPPSYVAELIEYKVFCTYMVSSSPSSGCSTAIRAIEEDAIEIRLMSRACIHAPSSGGCVKCPHSDDDSDYCFKLSSWKRYKEFCPD